MSAPSRPLSALGNIARLLVVTSVAAASLSGAFQGAGGTPFPETVTGERSVDLAALRPDRDGRRIFLGRAGALRARARATTSRAVICSPFWFDALGVVWEQTGKGRAAALVSVSDGRRGFGRVEALESEGGPDHGTGEPQTANRGTGLLWTGGSRCSRVALNLPSGSAVREVRVVFVNSSGTAAGPGTAPMGGVGIPAAQAMTRRPAIVTRAEWGANPNLMNCTPGVAPAVRMGFVHHTAGTNKYSRNESDDIVRAIYAYHTNGRGWCDIAYNFLADRYGRVFEGRSGGMTRPVIGAAQQGFNTGAFSVAAMGEFGSARPTDAMMRALNRLLAWRLDVAHLPPKGRARMYSYGGDNNRYPEGQIVNLPVIGFHRMTGYTACPGDRMVARIAGLRDHVNATGLPKLFRPKLSATELAPGVGPLEIRAKGSRKLRWEIAVRNSSGELVARLPERTGRSLDLIWRARYAPYPREAGRYTVAVEARGGKEQARGALLVLTYKLGFIVR